MGTNRPGQRYPYPNQTGASGFQNSNQRFPTRPSNTLGNVGREPGISVNNGGGQSQYYPTPNPKYYPPPPPPPRPPQAMKMIPPGTSDNLLSQSNFNAPSNSSRIRGLAPPPPVINSRAAAINPGVNGAVAFAPLVPPPLPPLFPYLSPELAQSFKEGAIQCGQSFGSFDQDSTDLPFVPIIINDSDLKKMTEQVRNKVEDNKGKNLLLYEDIINPKLPKSLKDMFQPLYCKLCKLTLTSPVVARDHYKGKRHKKAEELWYQNNPRVGIQISRVPDSSFINGTVTPIGQQSFDRNQYGINDRRPPLVTPLDQRDNRPFPVPGAKRLYEQTIAKSPGISNDFIPAYRASLAGPGPSYKKPKKEDGSGPNFGFCELCQVNLTSQANSDQHYNGKKHKEKLLSSRKCGEFGDDTRFGIGSSFNNRTEGAHNSEIYRQRYN